MTPERWQKIEQLCNAALERETSQRGSFLAQACQGDDELRREVESLLAQEKPAERFLESLDGEIATELLVKMHGEGSGQSMLGRQLGPYRIISLLGVGGMGEVYEARDTKLGRNVAIKVLPSAFVHDPDRLARFQREARMLAALNHPNIATIHGLEQSDSTHYLVMELVPGETLAERISKGALPMEEALKVGGQVAEALEAAHEKGVIHRDLKPANIKLTPEGRVKVLDFGLAKAFAGDGAQDLSQLPTLTATGSEEGKILGTPAYMSPEQARGKPIDKRTDIWAFGCVLYELLTGKQSFQGETVTEILAAVLKGEPDWQALPVITPQSIQMLLRRCLQKDVNKRCRDAGDVRIEIEEPVAAPSVSSVSTVPAKRGRRGALILSLGTLLLGVAIAGVTVWNLKPAPPPPPQPVSRFTITLPPGQELAGLDRSHALALSPDGRYLVYVARQGGVQQLYLRPMNGLESKPIPGTEGAINPFFSPDSQWLAFFADGKLKKLSVRGGAAIILGDAVLPLGGSWGTQDTIAFAPTTVSPIEQMSDAGGTAQPLTRLENGQFNHAWPEFLPDGKNLLFTIRSTVAGLQVAVQPATGERRILAQGGTEPRYTRSGHLVYAQNGSLMAVPFDLQRLAATGKSVPVLDGVLQFSSGGGGAAQYSFSATGSLVYVLGHAQASQRRLVRVDRKGAETPLSAPPSMYAIPRLSPDGRRIAVSTGLGLPGTPIFLYDLSRETLTRYTLAGTFNQFPIWTPDGKRIAFDSNLRGPAVNLFWQLADGSGGLERLTMSEFSNWPTSWSPDGQLLAYVEGNPTTAWDIWVLRMSDRKAQPFVRTPANEGGPKFSPDGRWMAYASDESGPWEVYVQPYPGPGGKWQISTGGGTEPVWNPNGKELFYRNEDKMMATDINTKPGFSAGKPHMLFEGPYLLSQSPIAAYDISADGQRFLMIKPDEQILSTSLNQIVVVQNWFEELKRRVPTGK